MILLSIFRQNFHFLSICYFFISLLLATSVSGQASFSSQAEMEQAWKEAKRQMVIRQGDKALAITKRLLKQLKKEGHYASQFGFQVRLTHALALYESSEEAPSLKFLWKLKDESKAYQEWSVFVDVCRDIAKIQEINNQEKTAYKNLQEAKFVIGKYAIDSIYSSFAVRYSSWHRRFGDLDSAYFYAQEAIQSAQRYKQTFEEAEGNFLLASIIMRKGGDSLKVTFFCKKAASLYQKAGDFNSTIWRYFNLAELYIAMKKYQKALNYIDTASYYRNKYPHHDNLVTTSVAYEYKGKIFKELGLMDSAIIYLTKGYENQIKYLNENKQKELIEVGKKYNLEKKNKELKEEKDKSKFLIVMVILFVLFLLILFLYYSKLQKANRLTQEQAKELKKLDQLKSRFFANVSHELRTPLTLILAPVREILAENQLNKKTVTHLNLVEKNTKKLQQMVNSLLDFSKLDADKMTINAEPISWYLFLKQTYANFESLADFKKVEFNLNYQGDESLVLALDRLKIETIFNNLLSNAFKFTSGGGKVTISAGVSKTHIWTEIQDTGRGIASEDLPYIFNRFYQAKNKVAEGGTGIGLALTQELINLLKGEIEVKSEVGKGTTFKLQIPLAKVNEKTLTKNNFDYSKNRGLQEVSQLPSTEKQKVEKTQDNTILLVEDNPDLALFIQTILEEYYTVITASNGQKALDKLAQFPNIQLVLSDVMMPVMDGFQLLENLKASPVYKTLPIIMLTARASLKDKLNALRIGVDDYLTKPFIKEELVARIGNLLQNAQGRKELLTYELEENESETKSAASNKEELEIQEWLDNLEQVVLKNIEISEFTVGDIAAEMCMSKRQIYRKIKQHIGLTPLQYIKTYKLNYARELLENKKVNAVKVAAYSIGYPSVVYFRREFKKAFGRVPSDYLA